MSASKSKRSQPSKGSGRGRNGRGGKSGGGGSGRYFFALRVPDAVAARLAEEQGQLRGNWRRVEAGHMHITLAYLPRVPAARMPQLKRLGADAADACPPLDLRLKGTGYFPNQGSPRVWFVKVEQRAEGREQRAELLPRAERVSTEGRPEVAAAEGREQRAESQEAEALAALAERLRGGIGALELATDDKPFKAHITLARKKGPAPRVPPIVFEGEEWQARHLYLIRSTLRKTGPIYETVSRFELRGESANLPTETNSTEDDSSQPAPLSNATHSNATQEQP